MVVLYIVFVAGLCAAVHAKVATFHGCKNPSRSCRVNELRITPCKDYKGSSCNIRPGSNVNIEVDFTPDFYAEDLGAKVYLGDTKFRVASDDACQFTDCPARSGRNQTLHFTSHVSIYKAGYVIVYKTKIFNKAREDTEYCCFKTTITYTV